MKIDNYIVIQGWMRTELNLKGNDLLVYAIIYGFSQTENQKYTGGLQYIADWCGATKQGIIKNLNNLLERGLIEKKESYVNNIKTTEYRSTEFNSVKLSLTNNIYNNISTNVDIDNISNNTNVLLSILPDGTGNSNFLVDKPKKKRMNLYEKCYTEIVERYTDNILLQNILDDYLHMCLERKDEKRLKGFAQWKGLLNKLDSMHGDKLAIVEQSIKKYWATFVEIKQYKYSNGKLNEPTAQSVVASTEEREKIERWRKDNGIESF